MASLVHATAHGLLAGSAFYFANVSPTNSGVDTNAVYYVLAAGLTADAFEFSTSAGGTAFVLTNAITDCSLVALEQYTVVADGNMDAPSAVPTPSDPTVTSALVSGIVRLQIALNGSPEAKVRTWEVAITHNFDPNGPVWTTGGSKITMPEGSTTASIPALGSTTYAVRVSATDVFGNVSAFSNVITHTTLAGNDGLNAALADLANDVSDGIITTTKIADGSITTPKLVAGSVTASILAATIVLSSLIQTATSGRRIEMDVDGIRLYDSDESLLVRIPTNGDPVFVKGSITADSFVSQTAATLRTAVSLEGSSVMTLQTGVSAPTTAPTVVASVDSLSLTSTPPGVSTAAGIGYDSGNTSYWVAADPSTGYVAHEFNGATGALIRSFSATGSTSVVTATLGSTSHVTDTTDALQTSTNTHIMTPLTMPRAGTITKVSCYLAGYSGSAAMRNGIWSSSGVARAVSATYTASSKTFTNGNDDHYDKAMTSSYAAAAGEVLHAGFYRTVSSDGVFWSKDDGSGKSTYSGDGVSNTDTGHGLYDSNSKPNVYITYTYTVDTRLETLPNIGVCTDGTYVYTLDTSGKVWKYLRADGSYVASAAVSLTGTTALAGLFYDATASKVVVCHATGTSGTDQVKFTLVTPSTLVVSSTVSATGFAINGSTCIVRGGVRLADPLNSSTAEYWVMLSGPAGLGAGQVVPFVASTGAFVGNRNFGVATNTLSGLTHDGTVFRGWNVATPTRVWKFSAWDWTTVGSNLYTSYAWYDSVVTTHETVMGPRVTTTVRRRERVLVQNPSIPTGGSDDPNNVRIYMLMASGADTGAGTFWLQVTDALTSRYVTTYASSGTHDGAGTAFPSGTPAELKSSATGWSLKGDGTIVQAGKLTTSGLQAHGSGTFPGSPTSGDIYYRTDLHLWFFYDGTRWLSVEMFCVASGIEANTGTYTLGFAATAQRVLVASVVPHAGTDAWIDSITIGAAISSGGTALGASHSWVAAFKKDTTLIPATALASITVNSGASGVHRPFSVAVGALLGLANPVVSMDLTKTGTPGNFNIFSPFNVFYRIVQT